MTAAARRAIVARYARQRDDKVIFCTPARWEVRAREQGHLTPQGPQTDGKVIYDSEAIATEAASEFAAIGVIVRPVPCKRSRHGHYHLTRDHGRVR